MYEFKTLNIEWISYKDYQEVHKINSFSRLGFTRFPLPHSAFSYMLKKLDHPEQGAQTLRMRRYNHLPTQSF